MFKKIVALTFLLIPFCQAATLNFPSHTPVTCIVSQKWMANGLLEHEPISEQCSSQVEFELILSPPHDYKRIANIKVTRLQFDVQTNSGVSASFDSNSPEKTVPLDLNQIFEARRLANIQISYYFYPGLSYVFDEMIDPLKKFLENVEKQFEQYRFNQHKDIFKATKDLWFFKSRNFENILSDLFYTIDTSFEPGSHHMMNLRPRFFTQLFAAEYGNVATGWFWRNNYFTQDLVLFINEVNASDVVGSWAGETFFKIKDPSGCILSENSTKNGTISWNRKNALLQNRSFTWEGDFQSDMKNTPAKVHFLFEETIQTKPGR